MWEIAILLCLLVLKLFMCSFLEHDSRWRQLSFVGLCTCYISKICLVYCVFFVVIAGISTISNLRTCVICASIAQCASHNRLDHFGCMLLEDSHLFVLGVCGS